MHVHDPSNPFCAVHPDLAGRRKINIATDSESIHLRRSRRLLKVKAAAEYISVSPKKLRSLIQAGELPFVKLGEGGPWLVDLKDLDALIERHKQMA